MSLWDVLHRCCIFGFVGVLVGFAGSESVIWLLLIMINILCGPLKQLCVVYWVASVNEKWFVAGAAT